MEHDVEYRRKVVSRLRPEVEPLFRYLPWLQAKKGGRVSTIYSENNVSAHSIAFPVYDSTLLGFVKEVQKSTLTDRNYVYIYTRYGINSIEDELSFIERVNIANMDILIGILSKYILGGMTKGWVWSQAVQEGIFLAILEKYQELFSLWEQPEENLGKQE